jgi:chemotaxis signal transduction protein
LRNSAGNGPVRDVWLNTDVPVRADHAANSERQLVVFSLHGEQYGVPIGTVREIVRYTRPTATAAATGLIRGLISLRGEVLPVVDLSSRLGREAHSGEGAQIVVLALSHGSLGLIVDHVEGVRNVTGDRITPSPVPGAEKGFGEEIAAIDDQIVLLIDPQAVLGSVLRPPATEPPATEPPATEPPATEPPATEPPATKPSAAKRPVAKRPAAKRPTAKRPAAKPSAAKRPAAKRPAAKPSAAKSPAVKDSAPKRPATKRPAMPNPETPSPKAPRPAAKRTRTTRRPPAS